MSTGEPAGPLAGIRVIDCSIALAGPYATVLLADQGADVIKVERPGIGDIGRYVGVAVNGMSALYQAGNRGKRCIAVDLQSDAGRDLVLALARDADVFVQNFRPGVIERLGLGYEAVAAVNPDIVYASVSGFGPEGPYAHKGAYDTVIQAYGGLAHSQRDNDTGEPRFLQQVAADKVSALTASQAITAALFARERGQGGQHLHVAMFDAVVQFLWADAAGNEVLLDSDHSQPSSFVQHFKPLRFADGWGIATPTGDGDFAGMCRAFGVEGHDDPKVATIAQRNIHRHEAGALIARCYEVAATMTTAEAIARMEAERVPCGVVLDPARLHEDPHVIAVGMLEESTSPVVGRVRQPRHAARFGATPAVTGGPAPALGQHTDEVLAEAGWNAGEIARLRAAGVIA